MLKDALCFYMNFLQTMSNHERAINMQLDSCSHETIKRNREALKNIAEIVIFLGRQDLPFRGHRDDGKYQAELGEQSTASGVGLFNNMINFRIISGDNILRKPLSTTARNAKYKSAPIQNTLISGCGKALINKLSKEISEAGFFSVLADKATDCSIKEQMALIIRFLDKKNVVREEFLYMYFVTKVLLVPA